MYELTNEQRKCFGLLPVDDAWEKVVVKPSPYDNFITYAYLDGRSVRKVVLISKDESKNLRYSEYAIEAMLSEDHTMLLPKTSRGKEILFSSSNLLKYTAAGMALEFDERYLWLFNATSKQNYYHTWYDETKIPNKDLFKAWVEDWCRETGEKELAEIEKFASVGNVHQKFREGDFFRFRISRKLYGYGRILLDFAQMRKKKIPFWDIFMGKPICAAVYHIVTERDDVTPDELIGLPMLPSCMIMDNVFFYGEYPIIGNAPLTDAEQNYPVHYGPTISAIETGTRYQCGKTFIRLDDAKALDYRFINLAIGFQLNVRLSALQKCIEAHSNQPYWDMSYPSYVDNDLRNPKYAETLQKVRLQMGFTSDGKA